MLYYPNSQFYINPQSIQQNAIKFQEQDKYHIDDAYRMRLGNVRPDKFDDLVLYYQGHQYWNSTPTITSIRPPLPDGKIVGVKPYYVEATNSQVIDVSGTMVPINMIKPQQKVNYSVFN